jgi:hypothetical protein
MAAWEEIWTYELGKPADSAFVPLEEGLKTLKVAVQRKVIAKG